MKPIRIILVISILVQLSCKTKKPVVAVTDVNPFQYSINKTVESRNGSRSISPSIGQFGGLEILKKGGNAIDASIATQLALAVVYPGAGNIGGGDLW
jgi:gamma-glutamyltranspeptidase/glutathione hydrolase